MSKKGSPGPDWKHAWHDARTGDDVFLNEDEGQVLLDVGPRCVSHTETLYCHRCLPRLTAAADAARKCLDPKAEPFEVMTFEKEEARPYVALFNPMQRPDARAYAIRYDRTLSLSFAKPVLTTKHNNAVLPEPLVLADYLTRSQVCDAFFLSAFSVRLRDGVPEHYARRLWEARLTFYVDYTPLLKGVPFREILQKKEVELPRHPDEVLFSAIQVDEKNFEADPSQWLGYILPNGSQIRITLDGVQGGGGLVFIETRLKLLSYTTKKAATSA